MKKLFILIAILSVSLTSCLKDGQSIEVSEQSDNYNPKFLFEVDGVKVYRFVDGGEAVYFTNSAGLVEWEKTESNGKTTYKKKKQTLCN